MKKELNKGMRVNVYDGDCIGWTLGTLEEKINSFGSIEKWRIKTIENYTLERFVKVVKTREEMKTDCFAYILVPLIVPYFTRKNGEMI